MTSEHGRYPLSFGALIIISTRASSFEKKKQWNALGARQRQNTQQRHKEGHARRKRSIEENRWKTRGLVNYCGMSLATVTMRKAVGQAEVCHEFHSCPPSAA